MGNLAISRPVPCDWRRAFVIASGRLRAVVRAMLLGVAVRGGLMAIRAKIFAVARRWAGANQVQEE